jgi:AcrR family transcriptional regulator
MSVDGVKSGNGVAVAETGRQGVHVEEMQRRRLLSAFAELVGEDGLESASVGAICKRAGVSRRTFYEVFEDREQCFLAAFEQAIERIARDVVPAYTGTAAQASSWRARVHAAVRALLEHFDADPDVARMCVVETLRAGREVLQRRRRLLVVLAEAVDEGRTSARNADSALPLTAEGVVGGALAVLHTRLLEADDAPLGTLANGLTGTIVHPYLGAAVARRELERPAPKPIGPVAATTTKDPFKDLPIRFTYRTARVMATIAGDPGASNRLIADSAGVTDDGQISRLLRRLESAGLIENLGEGHTRGEPNAWWLTDRGEAIHATLAGAPSTA